MLEKDTQFYNQAVVDKPLHILIQTNEQTDDRKSDREQRIATLIDIAKNNGANTAQI